MRGTVSSRNAKRRSTEIHGPKAGEFPAIVERQASPPFSRSSADRNIARPKVLDTGGTADELEGLRVLRYVIFAILGIALLGAVFTLVVTHVAGNG
jgi:hypothetical protein